MQEHTAAGIDVYIVPVNRLVCLENLDASTKRSNIVANIKTVGGN